MTIIFGLDVGTTSIGFAVIDDNAGAIKHLGVRVFPEARDSDGTPLNQQRRQKRMTRRQLRRRRARRKLLNETLTEAGLLPLFSSRKDSDWANLMKDADPYGLRARGLKEALGAHEFGRALYHLAKRRHFKGGSLDGDDVPEESDDKKEKAKQDKEEKASRETTLRLLKEAKTTLGGWLSGRQSNERKRGEHVNRAVVEEEFEKIWTEQEKYLTVLRDENLKYLTVLRDENLKESIREAIFAQRPVFWRKNTLGECPFMPDEPLCPKGSWMSQQRRMLERVNNLALTSGNARPLDEDERHAILGRLQTQISMTWGGVRKALAPLYKERGEPGMEKRLKFNLEASSDKRLNKQLIGNAVEAKLAGIFGHDWPEHPRKQAIRDSTHDWLWSADYDEIGTQRVVILSEKKRKERRAEAEQRFIDDLGVNEEQAKALSKWEPPRGWEPYSTKALQKFLPELEKGARFGALLHGPDRRMSGVRRPFQTASNRPARFWTGCPVRQIGKKVGESPHCATRRSCGLRTSCARWSTI